MSEFGAFFDNATITIYSPELVQGFQEKKVVYKESSKVGPLAASKVPRANFEESTGYGAMMAGMAPFSVEQFNMDSSIDCPVNAVILYNCAGSEDDGLWFEVLSREQRADWFFGRQSVMAKRVEPITIVA